MYIRIAFKAKGKYQERQKVMSKKIFKLTALVSMMVLSLTACSGATGATGPTGATGATGEKGADGVSITSVAKTGSEGLVDTYTITYSDGKTATFTVTNGAAGADGAQGIQGIAGADGHSPVVTINADGNWVIDGVDSGIAATGNDGADGEDAPHAGETHTVTFNLNGGEFVDEGTESVWTVEWGDTLDLPLATKGEQSPFAGWYIDSDDVNNPSRQWYTTDAVFTDITLTAHYEEPLIGNVRVFNKTFGDDAKFAFYQGGKELAAYQLATGEPITLKATGLGTSLSTSTTLYAYIGDEVVSANPVLGEDGTNYECSFEFTLSAFVDEITIAQAIGTVADSGYTVNVGTLPEGITIYGFKDGDKYSGYSGTIYAEVEEGYSPSISWKITSGSDEGDTGTVSLYSFDGLTGWSGTIYNYNQSFDLTITNNYVGVANFTYEGTENIASVDGDTDYVLPSKGLVGKMLQLYSIKAVDGKYISSIKVLDEAGEVVYTGTSNNYLGYSITKEGNYTVSFEFADNKKIEYVGEEEWIEDIYFTNDWSYSGDHVTSLAAGSTLYVHVKPASGYQLNKILYTYGESSGEASISSEYGHSGYYSGNFKVPDGDVSISFDVSKLYSLTVGDSGLEGFSITTPASQAAAGTETYFYATTADKYHKLVSVEAKCGDTTETWTEDSENIRVSGSYWYFTMPEGDLTLTPKFEEIPTTTIEVTADTGFSQATVSSSITYVYQRYDYTDGADNSFKVRTDEELSFSLSATDTTKYAVVVWTDSNGVKHDLKASSFSSYTSYDYYAFNNKIAVTQEDGSTITSIKYELRDREVVKSTINNDIDGAKLTYTVNGEAATDLSAVKTYDSVGVTLDSSACEEGYIYSVKVTDSDGNALSTNYSGYYVINGDFTVTVTKSVKHTVTLVTPSTFKGFNLSAYVNGSYTYDDLDEIAFKDGDVLKITYISAYDSNWNYFKSFKWTVSDGTNETVYENVSSSNPIEITITSDVTITVEVA